MCANPPLLLSNCAPLSFLDVDREDYALAMIAVYERLDLPLARELFQWTYERSIAKYRTLLDAMGLPDPFRARYREVLGDVVRRIDGGMVLGDLLPGLSLPEEDRARFEALVRAELKTLAPYNCARYRLSLAHTEAWIAQGRPS